MGGLLAGQIQFYDRYEPPLAAGDYTATVTQEVSYGGQATGAVTQAFHVVAPQVALEPGDLHAVYPPPNSAGTFEHTLPHIVLSRQTLPWDRPGVAPSATGRSPWVALLVFQDDPANPELPSKPGADGDRAVQTTSGQLVQSDGSVQTPVGLMLEDPDRACRAIEVPADVFGRIAPACEDLEWLAHARQVNTADKEVLGLKEEGWFSLVIANRLPKPGLRHIVHLVSLEGLGAFLPCGGKPSPLAKPVRLATLASWSFYCQDSGGNFDALMANMAAAPGGVELLRVPQPAQANVDANSQAAQAIAAGYVPLSYATRQGEETVVWYRGPLNPVLAQRAARDGFDAAENALMYDPVLGMFDVSYAVAWQIGRLLALSDGSFARALLDWRRKGHQLVDLLQARIARFQSLGSTLQFPSTLSGRLQPRLLPGLMAEFFRKDIQGLLATTLAPGDASGLRSVQTAVPGVFSPSELAAAVEQGRDPHELLFAKVQQSKK